MEYAVLVVHTIQDYRKWRPLFDADEEARLEAGMTEPRVYRNVDRPNELIIQVSTASLRLAREFLASPEPEKRMADAGVAAPPTIYFLETV